MSLGNYRKPWVFRGFFQQNDGLQQPTNPKDRLPRLHRVQGIFRGRTQSQPRGGFLTINEARQRSGSDITCTTRRDRHQGTGTKNQRESGWNLAILVYREISTGTYNDIYIYTIIYNNETIKQVFLYKYHHVYLISNGEQDTQLSRVWGTLFSNKPSCCHSFSSQIVVKGIDDIDVCCQRFSLLIPCFLLLVEKHGKQMFIQRIYPLAI